MLHRNDPASPAPRVRRLRVAGAVLLTAAALGGLAACGDDGDSGEAAGTTSAPAAGSTAAASLPTAGPVAAGDYRTAKFQPALELSLDEGWAMPAPELSDVVGLIHTDTGSLLAFVTPTRVFDPSDDAGTKRVAAPEDLTAFLREHPRLKVGPAEPVTVAGASGVGFDMAVRPGRAQKVVGCPGECVSLIGFSDGGAFGLLRGDRDRVTVLDVGGRELLVFSGGPAGGYAEFNRDVERVLDEVVIPSATAQADYSSKPML
jgi:hypothetical protein